MCLPLRFQDFLRVYPLNLRPRRGPEGARRERRHPVRTTSAANKLLAAKLPRADCFEILTYNCMPCIAVSVRSQDELAS